MLWVNGKPSDWNSCYGLWCISPPNRLQQIKEFSNMIDCLGNLPQSSNVALGTTRIVDCPLRAVIPMVDTFVFALLSLCVAKRDYRTTGGVIRGPNLVYFSDRNNCWARQIFQLINKYWVLSNNVTISGQYSLLIFIIVVFCMQNSRPECFHALTCHTIFCHRMWYVDLIYWHIISFHLTSYYYAIFCKYKTLSPCHVV